MQLREDRGGDRPPAVWMRLACAETRAPLHPGMCVRRELSPLTVTSVLPLLPKGGGEGATGTSTGWLPSPTIGAGDGGVLTGRHRKPVLSGQDDAPASRVLARAGGVFETCLSGGGGGRGSMGQGPLGGQGPVSCLEAALVVQPHLCPATLGSGPHDHEVQRPESHARSPEPVAQRLVFPQLVVHFVYIPHHGLFCVCFRSAGGLCSSEPPASPAAHPAGLCAQVAPSQSHVCPVSGRTRLLPRLDSVDEGPRKWLPGSSMGYVYLLIRVLFSSDNAHKWN